MAVAVNTKPVVLPDSFTGEAGWDEWITHFENVADVNGWSAAQKLKWIKVRLTGQAQKAFQRLPEASLSDYKEAKKALKARFEPESKKTRYQAEFQTRRKKKFENWADFVRLLADKAFPELQDEARERLALNSYLSQLDQPQVAFSVKQKRPESGNGVVCNPENSASFQRAGRRICHGFCKYTGQVDKPGGETREGTLLPSPGAPVDALSRPEAPPDD